MVRRVLITGANKGIGLAIARRCLSDHSDSEVVMACRSTARGAAAIDLLASEEPAWRARLRLLELDTSSDASVEAAAAKLRLELGDEPQLYAICNNAGIAGGSLAEVFNVNLRGPRRVVNAFVGLLDGAAGGGRVVQISSGAASQCVVKCSAERQAFLVDPSVEWGAIEALVEEVCGLENGVAGFEALGLGASLGGYGLSKACLNSYTMLVAREHPELRVNACSPGMIATDIVSQMLPWFVPAFLGKPLARLLGGALSPDEGTVAPMFLLFGEPEGSGRYYGSDGKRSPLDSYRKPGSAPFE